MKLLSAILNAALGPDDVEDIEMPEKDDYPCWRKYEDAGYYDAHPRDCDCDECNNYDSYDDCDNCDNCGN